MRVSGVSQPALYKLRHRSAINPLAITRSGFIHLLPINQVIPTPKSRLCVSAPMPQGWDGYNQTTNLWSLTMTVSTILLIILVLIVIGAIPAWPHSRSWGYGPSGVVGTILVVLLILLLLGKI